MCGRMTQQTDPAEIARIFDAEVSRPADFADLPPRFNVAPTQPLTVVVQHEEGRFVEQHRWGMVPPWSKSVATQGARLINARAETVARSPAFRASFSRHRCIVPADGFYEWRRAGRVRQPFLIHRPDGAPMAFAGLWSPWRDPASGEWLLSAAVITTTANATVSQLHDRMPVILGPQAWATWLDPFVTDPGRLNQLLGPAPDDAVKFAPASMLVNSPHNEGPELLVADHSEPITLFG
jgi:putative SOS response-associated peptidase YedK